MAQRKVETFEGQRITLTTKTDYAEVLARLEADISSGPTGQTIDHVKEETQQAFIEVAKKRVGPHDFIRFHEFDHGRWIPLFGVGNGLRLKRVILGNPLIAITMIKHDLTAGMYVPVELLLKERAEGGTDVVYFLPSSLIAPVSKGGELEAAAKELDRKFEKLCAHIAS